MIRVYIRDYNLYLPRRTIGYRALARETKLPQFVVKEKQGILSKPLERKLSTSEMCIASMKPLVRRNGPEAKKASFLIYAGSDFKDHYIWTIAPKICWESLHRKIGAFDISAQCVGSLVGLDMAKSKLTTLGPDGTGFVTLSTKQSMIVNLKRQELAFFDDFSDGAVSVLLTNQPGKYEILQSSFISDGTLSEVVWAPFGERHLGEKNKWDYQILLNEVGDWREQMEKNSGENFKTVIRESLKASGYGTEDVSYLAILHMKRSFHQRILKELGISENKSVYLEGYGHMQGVDPFLSLMLAEERKMIKDGDVVVLVSSGTGWIWGATTLVARKAG
jgi:3-oxoacyl-[acyl-carrier-protein] synthase-3